MNSFSHQIPDRPPPELLAELGEATRVLDALTARAAELTLGIDAQTRGLRFELREGEETRRLTPTQLLDLLAGN